MSNTSGDGLRPVPISISGVPPNNATYSQAVRMGGLLFLSGQLGMKEGALVEGGIREQTRQALDNIATILTEAGSSLDRVAKVNIFITDFSLLPQMNEVYARYFPHCPAKTTVEITRLDKNALIEIEVVAGAS